MIQPEHSDEESEVLDVASIEFYSIACTPTMARPSTWTSSACRASSRPSRHARKRPLPEQRRAHVRARFRAPGGASCCCASSRTLFPIVGINPNDARARASPTRPGGMLAERPCAMLPRPCTSRREGTMLVYPKGWQAHQHRAGSWSVSRGAGDTSIRRWRERQLQGRAVRDT